MEVLQVSGSAKHSSCCDIKHKLSLTLTKLFTINYTLYFRLIKACLHK